jgi:hypothetical protein
MTTTVSPAGIGAGVSVVEIVVSAGRMVVLVISGPISAVLEGVGVPGLVGVRLALGDDSVSEGAIATWLLGEAASGVALPVRAG